MHGHKTWFFPDGDLPAAGDVEPKGHESLVVLNAGSTDATIELMVYFTDRPAVKISGLTVLAERVRCFRLDKPLVPNGWQIPFGQYAMKLSSSAPVICQIGRMDRTPDVAYYTVMGFPED